MGKDLVIIAWGDSIVYGWHDNEYGGWVNRLKIKLYNRKKTSFIFNMGIPGQKSLDILKRFEEELKNRFNNEDDFKLIFAFGIKDSLLLNKDIKYTEHFEKNVNEIINKALKYSKDICFIGIVKPDLSKRKEYNLDNVLKIDEIIERQCQINKIKYIEIKNLLSKDDLYDGLHPNAVGYEKICNKILNNF